MLDLQCKSGSNKVGEVIFPLFEQGSSQIVPRTAGPQGPICIQTFESPLKRWCKKVSFWSLVDLLRKKPCCIFWGLMLVGSYHRKKSKSFGFLRLATDIFVSNLTLYNPCYLMSPFQSSTIMTQEDHFAPSYRDNRKEMNFCEQILSGGLGSIFFQLKIKHKTIQNI